MRWAAPADGHDLEALHDGEDLVHRLARDRADRGAHVGDVWHQPLRLEELQGLADRDRAHLELTRQLVDHEPLARLELAAHDRVAQRPVDELLLRAEAQSRGEWRAAMGQADATILVFFWIASKPAMHARAEPIAVGPARSGLPVRTAAQKPEIS